MTEAERNYLAVYDREKPASTKEVERAYIPYLQEKIRELRQRFHSNEDFGMTDHDFDVMKHTLYVLEQRHPDLITPDSPTQTIESGLLEVKNEKELEDWVNSIKKED